MPVVFKGEPVDKVWLAKCVSTTNNVFVLFWGFLWEGRGGWVLAFRQVNGLKV